MRYEVVDITRDQSKFPMGSWHRGSAHASHAVHCMREVVGSNPTESILENINLIFVTTQHVQGEFRTKRFNQL